MLFNSIDFAIFLPIVFILYWFVTNRSLKLQNLLIFIASYVFYGWWDWKFLSLILFSTVVDYFVGLKLKNETRVNARKMLLWTSICVNIGLLAYFKYANFFIDNFVSAFTFLGHEIQPHRLNIILPVGISFYTFQTLSYTIDVYNKKLAPTHDFIGFAAFVSFFPQLVAGPIERAKNLLPQFYQKRVFNYDKASDGMRQILWGLFKKIVIADNCAMYVDHIFANYTEYAGSTLVIGAVLFAFQIYADFSGYSDIAIGTARLFGFDLMKNFAFPYFSRDIAEFWRRWHISLSTWFRDYVYIPLGGSRVNKLLQIRNVIIIFVVSGFWHGANWTYIIWGLLNALFFIPYIITNKHRRFLDNVAENSVLPSFKELLMMSGTFAITVFAWIFFRAYDIPHAFHYIEKIFTFSTFTFPQIFPIHLILLIILFLIVEWFGRRNAYGFEKTITKLDKFIRYAAYCLIIFIIFYYKGEEQQFIYFQF